MAKGSRREREQRAARAAKAERFRTRGQSGYAEKRAAKFEPEQPTQRWITVPESGYPKPTT